MYRTLSRPKKIAASAALLLWSAILLLTGAAAANAAYMTNGIAGDFAISGDTVVETLPDQAGALTAVNGTSITVLPGTEAGLSIFDKNGDVQRKTNAVVADENGTVDLRELESLEIGGPFASALRSTGTLKVGDNVSVDLGLHGAKQQNVTTEAVWAGAKGHPDAIVSVGDNLNLKANMNAVYASDGGSVEIGGGATISSEIGKGVYAYGADTTADSKSEIHVGDNAVIDAYQEAFQAGRNADATIGDNAQLTSRTVDGVSSSYADTTVTVGDNAQIRAGKIAAFAYFGGALTIGDSADLTSANIGVESYALDSQLKIGNGLKVNAAGIALYADAGGIEIGDSADITSLENAGAAAYNGAGSTIEIGDNARIQSAKQAIDARNGSRIGIGDAVTIASSGGSGVIAASDDAKVEIGSGAFVSSYADSLAADQGGQIAVGDDAAIVSTTRKGAYAANGANITIGNNAAVNTTADTALFAQSGKISVGDHAALATSSDFGVLSQLSGSEISIGKDAAVDATYIDLYAAGGGKIEVGDGATLTAPGDGASAVTAQAGGQIEIGSARIATNNGSGDLALYAQGVNEGYPTSTIAADGVYEIKGSLLAEGDARIDLAMQDGSNLNGAAAISKGGAIDMTMNGARWEMTGNSALSSLALDGSSSVAFSTPSDATLTTDTLSGNGTFEMNAEIAQETADRLVVNKSASGAHTLRVANRGDAPTTGHERVLLVETADRGGSFALQGDTVEAGGWKYALVSSDDGRGQFDQAGGQHWELAAAGPSNPGSAGVSTLIGNYFMTYAETDALVKRLGDLRENRDGGKNGAWFRGFGGKMESDGGNYTRGFDMDYWGVQTGYDRLLDRDRSWFKNGDTYVGAFIGLSKGTVDFEQAGYGNGDLENRTIGIYASHLADSGYYFDAVAKYVWSKNKFNAQDSAGDLVQGGSIDTGGVGLSIEAGKRFPFGVNEGGSWYFEPQAQLSWQSLGSGTFNASNGLRVGVDSYDSLIGRLGFRVGYQNAGTNFYAKLSYLKEFDGEMHVNANDAVVFESLNDSWFVYGFGITHHVNDRNDFYLDLERAAGGDFEQEWNLSAGWRMYF